MIFIEISTQPVFWTLCWSTHSVTCWCDLLAASIYQVLSHFHL